MINAEMVSLVQMAVAFQVKVHSQEDIAMIGLHAHQINSVIIKNVCLQIVGKIITVPLILDVRIQNVC